MQFERSFGRILVFGFTLCLVMAVAVRPQRHNPVDVQLATRVAQVERGQRGEIRVFGKNLVVKSAEITPAEEVVVQEVRETTPAPDDRRQQEKGVRVWSIILSVEPTAQPGERSMVVVTADGPSTPQSILVVTHIPRISELKVLRAQSDGAQVQFMFTIYDDAGDVDLSSIAGRAYVFCSNGAFGLSLGPPDKVVTKDSKTSTVWISNGLPGTMVSGACSLEVYIQDKSGIQSLTLKAPLDFK